MAGRLARYRATGHGVATTAQFGGGTSAIAAVPVTPRGTSQLVTDSVVALLCLAIVLLIAFRLVAARRAAAAAAPAGPGPPGAGIPGAAWTGPARAGHGTPADYRPTVGYPEQQGYGSPNVNGTVVGYQPSAAEQPGDYPARPPVGSPGSYGPPHNTGGRTPPVDQGSTDGSQTPASDRHNTGGPSADYGSPADHGSSAEYGSPANYGSPADYGLAAWFGPQAGDEPPTGYRRPGVTQAPGSFPDGASTRPLSVYQHQEPSAPTADQAEDPPTAADDDTWPPTRQW